MAVRPSPTPAISFSGTARCGEEGVRSAQNGASWPVHSRRKYSYKRLKLAQLLGQLGVFLTLLGSCKLICAPRLINITWPRGR